MKKNILAFLLITAMLLPLATPFLGIFATEVQKGWLAIRAASASSSARADLGPANLLDGDPTTFWSSVTRESRPSSPDYVTLSLNGKAKVSKIALTPRSPVASAFPKSFHFEYLTDEGTFEKIPGGEYKNHPTPKGEKIFSFAAVKTTKIRIVGTHYGADDNGSVLMQFGDVRVFGQLLEEAESDALFGESPIAQPYAYLSKSGWTGKTNPLSPDPIYGYRFEETSVDDALQIYLKKPVLAYTDSPASFSGLDSVSQENTSIVVTGPGTIVVDFGVEVPAWFEIDSPDLTGKVTMSVSEYNQPGIVNSDSGAQSPIKTATPVKYGDSYRLELNSDLFEGVRFGFIHVEEFDQPFTITDLRAVCQIKPSNYNSEFHSDNEVLDRIWYTAAYEARVALLPDYIGSILIERGDRHSWTGDAYTTQAAMLVALGNYEEIHRNLYHTDSFRNGLESYELYWVQSAIDYYMYSGDSEGMMALVPKMTWRLDHAYDIFNDPGDLSYFGSDERLGASFENPNREESRNAYRAYAIGLWKRSADVLEALGENALAAKYRRYAEEKTKYFSENPELLASLGLHAASDAITAGVVEDLSLLYHEDFQNRLTRVSHSPFNEYFVLNAMADAGEHEDAVRAVLDMWGGMLEYGATTFFENFSNLWNAFLDKNDPVPSSQSGFTSLAHPWATGVLHWMNEELLGVKPVTAGFESFSVLPHPGSYMSEVSGKTFTSFGHIEVSVNMNTGKHTLKVPEGTTATMGIPKVGMQITSVKLNGKSVTADREDEDFLYFDNLKAGAYSFDVVYRGSMPKAVEEDYIFPAEYLGKDETTLGNWGGAYGSDGYVIVGADNGADLCVLPDYVEAVRFHNGTRLTPVASSSDTAPAQNAYHIGERVLSGYRTLDTTWQHQTFTVDIDLKEDRKFTMALYFADWDEGEREQCVELYDGKTLNLIAPIVKIEDFEGGVYLVYQYDRSLRIRVNRVVGTTAILSGIFFGDEKGKALENPMATKMTDSADTAIHYSGNWTHISYGLAYNKTLSYSNVTGNYAEYTFTGNSIAYIGSTENNRGYAEILIDGVSYGEIDTYSPDVAREKVLFYTDSLSDGEHTIRIVVKGKKHPLSDSTYVDLDGFATKVKSAVSYSLTYDDRDPSITYDSSWTKATANGTYENTFTHASKKGATATIDFVGNGISVVATKDSNRGIVEIYLDGVLQGKVDLYSSTTKRNETVFTAEGLDPTAHTLSFVVSGTKNKSSFGTYADIDAYTVSSENHSLQDIVDGMVMHSPQKGAATLTLPPVPKNMTLSIKSSSQVSVVSLDGKIQSPVIDTYVDLVLLAKAGNLTAERTVRVKILSSASLSASEKTIADQLVIPDPDKKDTKLALPTMPRGYSLELVSVTPAGLVKADGSFACLDKETKVTLVYRVKGSTSVQKTLTVTLPSGGHLYEDGFTLDKVPTATTSGLRSRHCARCDAKIDEETIQPTGFTLAKNGVYRIVSGDSLSYVFDQMAKGSIPSDATILLQNDITLDNSFVSIPSFSGLFDGQKHTISGVTKPLFINLSGEVKNLSLAGKIDYASYSAEQRKNAASIAITAKSAVVRGVSSSVEIIGAQSGGGLLGTAQNTTVSQASYSGKLTASTSSGAIGGIVGVFKGGKLSDCYFNGALSITSSASSNAVFVGGIAGECDASVTSVSASGTLFLSGKGYTGMLLGNMTGASLDKAVAAGEVIAEKGIKGAFVGLADNLTSITRSASLTTGLSLLGEDRGSCDLSAVYPEDMLEKLGEPFTLGAKSYQRYGFGVIDLQTMALVVESKDTDETIAASFSLLDAAEWHDLRVFLLINEEKLVDTRDVVVSVTFVKDGKDVTSAQATLGGNLAASPKLSGYRVADAAGELVSATDGCYYSGLVITDIPDGAWDTVTLTVRDIDNPEKVILDAIEYKYQ